MTNTTSSSSSNTKPTTNDDAPTPSAESMMSQRRKPENDNEDKNKFNKNKKSVVKNHRGYKKKNYNQSQKLFKKEKQQLSCANNNISETLMANNFNEGKKNNDNCELDKKAAAAAGAAAGDDKKVVNESSSRRRRRRRPMIIQPLSHTKNNNRNNTKSNSRKNEDNISTTTCRQNNIKGNSKTTSNYDNDKSKYDNQNEDDSYSHSVTENNYVLDDDDTIRPMARQHKKRHPYKNKNHRKSGNYPEESYDKVDSENKIHSPKNKVKNKKERSKRRPSKLVKKKPVGDSNLSIANGKSNDLVNNMVNSNQKPSSQSDILNGMSSFNLAAFANKCDSSIFDNESNIIPPVNNSSNRETKEIYLMKLRRKVKMLMEEPQNLVDLVQDLGESTPVYDGFYQQCILACVLNGYFSEAAEIIQIMKLREGGHYLDLAFLHTVLIQIPQNIKGSSIHCARRLIEALVLATSLTPSRTSFEEIDNFNVKCMKGFMVEQLYHALSEFLTEAIQARETLCTSNPNSLKSSKVCIVDCTVQLAKDVIQNSRSSEILCSSKRNSASTEESDYRGIATGDTVSLWKQLQEIPNGNTLDLAFAPIPLDIYEAQFLEGTVMKINPLIVRVKDAVESHKFVSGHILDGLVRIDKLGNRMGYQRQLTALIRCAESFLAKSLRPSRGPSVLLLAAMTNMKHMDDSGKVLNYLEVDEFDHRNPSELCATQVLETRNNISNDSNMNQSQFNAVNVAHVNRLTLIQGPPGTGKTRVAIEVLKQWCTNNYKMSGILNEKRQLDKILATSDSNTAVDNLLSGCVEAGLKVVRFGRPENVREDLIAFCLDRPSNAKDPNTGNRLPELSFKQKVALIQEADVICATCISSGSELFDNLKIRFRQVLVDEASQINESVNIVPLTRGCQQCVLLGDPCQLGPTVLSGKEGNTLFNRLLENGVRSYLLDTQYRMHPAIAEFPSDLFYAGKLKSGISYHWRIPPEFPWPRQNFPVAFLPVRHGIEQEEGTSKNSSLDNVFVGIGSKYNLEEAQLVEDVVKLLLEGGCSVKDIGIVTPYAAQVKLLRRLLRKFRSTSTESCQDQQFIEVSSTDGFQGREKEVIIFSAVRSNSTGNVGFVSDWRRINVSFTRAKRGLIVIGNDQTLKNGDPYTWHPWFSWAENQGINMDRPGESRGKYDPELLRKWCKDRQGLASFTVEEETVAKVEINASHSVEGVHRGDKRSHVKLYDGSSECLSLKEELALISNTDGYWDSSSEENDDLESTSSSSWSE